MKYSGLWVLLLFVACQKAPPRYADLPKVELHLHLDCSLSYDVVKKLRPGTTLKQYQDSFVAPPKCIDLVDFISRAAKGFQLMQTKEELRWVTLDLFQQLKKDNVVYAEIRFAPLQHLAGGLTPTEVVEVVNAATAEGIKTYGVDAGIILCTLRHFTEAQSMETVNLVKQFQGTHIVGFDIAADEAGFPLTAHQKAFDFAHAQGLSCTAHAGEAKGAESVWETLKKLQPTRIGHGVRSAEDPSLLTYLKQNDIHLEVCPTSNIQVNVFDKITDHPAHQLYLSGISMGINTDARTVAPINLTHEYEVMAKTFHWTPAFFKRTNLEAIRHAFAPDSTKEKIKAIIEHAY